MIPYAIQPRSGSNVSITQVAQQAGVSISTVSRYLRGTLNVSPSTAQKINEAALHWGYTPRDDSDDDSAIALIVPSLVNPFYSSLCEDISKAAVAARFTVDIKLSHGDSSQEFRLVDDIAKERRYHGLLYAGFHRTNAALVRIRSAGLRLVLVDEQIDSISPSQISTVNVDNYSGAYQAVRYLLSLGHRRIAYLSGPEELSTSRERLHGYSDALSAAGIPTDRTIIFSGPYTEEFGSSIFTYLVQNTDPPTAIFCGSDISAVGILGAAEQYGLKIPDDLSVIGCDGIHVGQWLKPSLTTLQQPMTDIAHSALMLLENNDTIQHIQLPLNLVIRGSTRRLEDRQ